MYSWTPKISDATTTTGQGPSPAGRATKIGREKPSVASTVTRSWISPSPPVVIGAACLARAAGA